MLLATSSCTVHHINSVDMDEWLSMYERVSKQNGWDPTIMLANVILYLGGTLVSGLGPTRTISTAGTHSSSSFTTSLATRLVDSLETADSTCRDVN